MEEVIAIPRKKCKYCDVIERKAKRIGGILYESKEVIAFMGTQHHKGHVIIATKRHVEDLLQLSHREHVCFLDCTLSMARAVKKVLKPDKINYAVLGNWIPHLHWHVYPRFKKDPDFGDPIDYSLAITQSNKEIVVLAKRIKAAVDVKKLK